MLISVCKLPRCKNTVKFWNKLRTYIFQGPFLRALFFEGLIFRGAYVRREICISKLIRLACSGKEIYHFALFYFVFEGKFQVQAPWGPYIQSGGI